MHYPIDENDILENQVWIFMDSAGFYSEVLIGNLDDLKKKILLSPTELRMLLAYGVTKGNSQTVLTFNWQLWDVIELEGFEYVITGVDITHFPNGFEVMLLERTTLRSRTESGTSFDLDFQRGTVTMIEKWGGKVPEKPKAKPILDNDIYCDGGFSCKVVDSFMPVSGEKFQYCTTHKKEVKRQTQRKWYNTDGD